MSQKNLDRKKRWRNITIAFRVSKEENKRINELVAMSGMTKQDYITQRLENEKITVVANSLVYLQIVSRIEKLYGELKQIQTGLPLSEATEEAIELISCIVLQEQNNAD